MRDKSRLTVQVHERSFLLFFFPRWVSAFVLGRRVFLRGRFRDFSAESMRHELIHACQYAEHGLLGFLWRYLWRERKVPYRQKTFEREAFDHQHDPSYIVRRWPLINVEATTREAKGSSPQRTRRSQRKT